MRRDEDTQRGEVGKRKAPARWSPETHYDERGRRSPSYASVVKGDYEDTCLPPPPPPPPLDRRAEEEAGWKIYSRKRQRQDTATHRATGQETRAPQRRSRLHVAPLRRLCVWRCTSGTRRQIFDVLSCIVDEEWKWEVKPLRDGRFIVAFPTAELARKTENGGPLRVLAFDFKLEPWTPDLWQTGKADGATRWVIVKNLPMECWSRDAAARLLKPAGDLVAVDRRSRYFGNDLLILLRIRWPRKMPSCIHCSMGIRQFTYTVELDDGQLALPWDNGPKDPSSATRGSEETSANKPRQPPEQDPVKKLDKGKAPMREEATSPVRAILRRPSGIIISERPPTTISAAE
ncbi:hypothetical protein J5N97_013502 [Dioscorea zingiberensis]|uniref:DUF4283 domain-containing protein n=1 Tax=Dioscorea zingiberensis TaxID=325984 RepID=A0A9D5CRB0_9LILI|nr:hypothetical protein J5N97_013502 [Dioscorea zingiberensis]